jgi:MYXO-CTERM domain-containing protein
MADGTACAAPCGTGACTAGACTCAEPAPVTDPGGCGCATRGGASPATLLFLLAGLALRPARPRKTREWRP